MRLALLHPDVAGRSCEECQQWLHDDRPGKFGAKVLDFTGKPIPRPKGTTPPCRFCPKIPTGVKPVPENACELSARHWQTWRFIRECRAVGDFPSDPIVRRNAALIEEAEHRSRDAELHERLELIAEMVVKAGLGKVV